MNNPLSQDPFLTTSKKLIFDGKNPLFSETKNRDLLSLKFYLGSNNSSVVCLSDIRPAEADTKMNSKDFKKLESEKSSNYSSQHKKRNSDRIESRTKPKSMLLHFLNYIGDRDEVLSRSVRLEIERQTTNKTPKLSIQESKDILRWIRDNLDNNRNAIKK